MCSDRAAPRSRQGLRSTRFAEPIRDLAVGGDRHGTSGRRLRRAPSDRPTLWPPPGRVFRWIRLEHSHDRADGSSRGARAGAAPRGHRRGGGLVGGDDHPARDRRRRGQPDRPPRARASARARGARGSRLRDAFRGPRDAGRTTNAQFERGRAFNLRVAIVLAVTVTLVLFVSSVWQRPWAAPVSCSGPPPPGWRIPSQRRSRPRRSRAPDMSAPRALPWRSLPR